MRDRPRPMPPESFVQSKLSLKLNLEHIPRVWYLSEGYQWRFWKHNASDGVSWPEWKTMVVDRSRGVVAPHSRFSFPAGSRIVAASNHFVHVSKTAIQARRNCKWTANVEISERANWWRVLCCSRARVFCQAIACKVQFFSQSVYRCVPLMARRGNVYRRCVREVEG